VTSGVRGCAESSLSAIFPAALAAEWENYMYLRLRVKAAARHAGRPARQGGANWMLGRALL
jgi:hypothetical protein